MFMLQMEQGKQALLIFFLWRYLKKIALLVQKILSINPDEVVTDTNVVLVEQHDDAIAILNKYHSSDSYITDPTQTSNEDDLVTEIYYPVKKK